MVFQVEKSRRYFAILTKNVKFKIFRNTNKKRKLKDISLKFPTSDTNFVKIKILDFLGHRLNHVQSVEIMLFTETQTLN